MEELAAFQGWAPCCYSDDRDRRCTPQQIRGTVSLAMISTLIAAARALRGSLRPACARACVSARAQVRHVHYSTLHAPQRSFEWRTRHVAASTFEASFPPGCVLLALDLTSIALRAAQRPSGTPPTSS
jgi:hypothetical protein